MNLRARSWVTDRSNSSNSSSSSNSQPNIIIYLYMYVLAHIECVYVRAFFITCALTFYNYINDNTCIHIIFIHAMIYFNIVKIPWYFSFILFRFFLFCLVIQYIRSNDSITNVIHPKLQLIADISYPKSLCGHCNLVSFIIIIRYKNLPTNFMRDGI